MQPASPLIERLDARKDSEKIQIIGYLASSGRPDLAAAARLLLNCEVPVDHCVEYANFRAFEPEDRRRRRSLEAAYSKEGPPDIAP